MNGVAFSGKAGAGKTTLAELTIAALKKRGHPAYPLAFGDALKREVRELYGVEKNDPAGRALLIGHGEARRDSDPLYWIRKVDYTLDELGWSSFVVLDDLRFPTELAWAKGRGFLTVRIDAPNHLRTRRLSSIGADPSIVTSASRTEVGLDKCYADFDLLVKNDGSLNLRNVAEGIAAHWAVHT